ncbi:DNA-binding transcriptional ArsR family regulator [Pontibacter ummariensis]|uniref:Transcriptional regulator, ArsR family n=1 Tax=Pontibacter ummariensis TaxID=1610492 RepID=A0A239KJU1_9BACT|nr:metalloregulator ArsR/SmtB family transcription factor [Pontibacter ummariensis]PRY05705.1 DNA-binding transcriptional ArsR family regulator [Pontibacter ummariensis]SNT18260.1 transcriptional regulator, ArsR family [Pontibacter ummariensis]
MSSLKVRVDQKKLERAAYVLKCVAHPVRISIIDLLEQRERLTVSQIQEVLQIEQSLLSHHLTNMRDKGLVDTQRQGKNVHYFLTDTSITNIIDVINGSQVL